MAIMIPDSVELIVVLHAVAFVTWLPWQPMWVFPNLTSGISEDAKYYGSRNPPDQTIQRRLHS